MNKKTIVSIIVLLLIGAGIYVYKDAVFLKDTASGVNSFNKEMLTRHVAFKKDTPESTILSLKASLESRIEVKSVTYISIQQGLQYFKERHPEVTNDEVAMQAASETILPKLEIILKSDDGGTKTKALKEFIESSTTSPYIVSF
jgi:hypothetical protein